MTLELLKALVTIVRFCDKQANCRTCPMREVCGKMPCDL